MVKEALAGGQEHILDTWREHLLERAIALHAQLQVGAISAYHIHLCGGQLVALLLIHPALHALNNLGVLKAVYVVVATTIATV